jgi:hypothetical protein
VNSFDNLPMPTRTSCATSGAACTIWRWR